MPDITMCSAENCHRSETCYRHQDSGTKPNEYRQSVFFNKEEVGDDCTFYWPKHLERPEGLTE